LHWSPIFWNNSSLWWHYVMIQQDDDFCRMLTNKLREQSCQTPMHEELACASHF
jgi:hypothetical protein